MKKLVLTFAFLAMLLSACGGVTPVAPAQATATRPPTQAVLEIKPLPSATPEPTQPPVSGGGYPPAVSAARADLAKQFNLATENLIPTAIISQDWPDSCLGAAGPGEMCAQVITPGFEITFVVGAAEYVYHTDLDGKNMRRVGDPRPAISGEITRTVLKWQSADCEVFFVSTQAAFFGKCAGDTPAVPGSEGLVALALAWAQEFAPFVAETVAGKVEFNGFGQTVATPAEQRMLAEWAKLQFDAAQSGRAGSAASLAFDYQRAGGFAGFCDDVAVYLYGAAEISNCKGFKASQQLTASQLEQVYAWYDGLAPVDYSHKDPAVADAMKITLTLPGKGQKTADEATIQAINEFAAALLAQSTFKARAGADLPEAEKALNEFFTALHSGEYILGAKLYGGDTSLLQTWNPDIQNDLPQWLERACTQNGLQCLLPRSVTYRGPDARGGYQFDVEFNNADGTLFRQGPCCGETSGVSNSVFLFSVVKSAETWQALDLPPYVP
jgi:hypothetical protein